MPFPRDAACPAPGPAMPEHSFEELTMADDKIALMAHLYRRAGFGATREELEAAAAREYEDVVEDLLHPERFPEVDVDIMGRYFGWDMTSAGAAPWMYRMVNTRRPLQEKMALFWHHVFATAYSKSEHPVTLNRQIDTFRRVGMRDLPTILMELSKDPAMIFWLDNNENHKGEPNENYGRELLELFSMGVGNYTEQDLKMAARAFTGWTFSQPIPLYPHGHYEASFVYDPEAHDDSEKSFLGENGRFDGEDIIEIVARQPAAPRFIARQPVQLLRSRRGPGAGVERRASQGPGRHRRHDGGLLRVRLRDTVGAAGDVQLRLLQERATTEGEKPSGAGIGRAQTGGNAQVP